MSNTNGARGQDLASRLREHVAHLAVGPRHRAIAGSMDRARDYCGQLLTDDGWQLTEVPFRAGPTALRTSDYGRRWWPFGAGGAIHGTNLIAHRGPIEGATWITAHLDSVHSSPGADDNASAVAVALELAPRIHDCDVALVLTDSEEAGVLGARQLAKAGPRPGRVINLESVGFFNDEPGTQRSVMDIDLAHRGTAKWLRANEFRADFLLAIHRDNSAEAAASWCGHAETSGLKTVRIHDRRWNGAAQRVTARLNPIGMNFDRSDHAAFWRSQVPAMVITDTAVLRNANYHRPSDTADTLDYARMARLTESLIRTLHDQRLTIHNATNRPPVVGADEEDGLTGASTPVRPRPGKEPQP